MPDSKEVDNLAYIYDGSLEGLFTCIFDVYLNKVNPIDIARENDFSPRLFQKVERIATDISKAKRVKSMLIYQCGYDVYRNILKASLSSDKNVGSYVLKYINYLVEIVQNSKCEECMLYKTCTNHHIKQNKCFKLKKYRVLDDIANPNVAPIFSIIRSIEKECEAMRQFARFEHLDLDGDDLWFARVNPKHSVVPLIMSHFVERFNIQAFVIYDENHNLAGVYEGRNWFMVNTSEGMISEGIKHKSKEEALIQEAWRSFYKAISIDSRYNPELQRNLMPKRLWKNLTEMQISTDSMLNFVGKDKV